MEKYCCWAGTSNYTLATLGLLTAFATLDSRELRNHWQLIIDQGSRISKLYLSCGLQPCTRSDTVCRFHSQLFHFLKDFSPARTAQERFHFQYQSMVQLGCGEAHILDSHIFSFHIFFQRFSPVVIKCIFLMMRNDVAHFSLLSRG